MNAITIARKEVNSFFNSWMGIFSLIFFYLVSGIFFSLLVISYARLSMESTEIGYRELQGVGVTRFVFGSFFLNVSAVLMFLVPVLTMRVYAEEKKMQTMELLFTYPLSDFDIVVGKFLGMCWIYVLMCLPTSVYALLMNYLGAGVDVGPLLLAYLGFFLLGVSYISLGLFISSLTESQVASAVITFCLLVVFWVLDWVAAVADGKWSHFFGALSPLGHFREFTIGILDLSNFVYFCFFLFFFLFLTLRSIETRNWKG